MAEPEYNEAIVKCLRIAYRRGRAILEAQERERQAAADDMSQDEPQKTTSPADALLIEQR